MSLLVPTLNERIEASRRAWAKWFDDLARYDSFLFAAREAGDRRTADRMSARLRALRENLPEVA